jgi:peptidoglycan/LPS O-acetylase OafA/YrhL
MDARNSHIPALQSIRGLAALTVLLTHSAFLFVTSPNFHFYSEALLNAHAAVMIFFVLSGYVLVRSLSNQVFNVETCARFYVGRSLAVLYLLLLHFQIPTLFTSPWYAQYFIASPKLTDFAKNMASVGFSLDPPTWSIRVELLASVILPFIAYFVRRALGLWLLAASIGMVFVAALHRPNVGGIDYLPSFVLGALAFQYQDRFGRILGRRAILLLSVMVLLFFRRIVPAWNFDTGYNALVPTLVESSAAAILIVGIVARPLPFLERRLVIRLGDISYSLYLIHFTVMSVLAKLIGNISINQDIRAVLLMVGTLAVSLPLSMLSYTYIEKPGIWCGRLWYRSFVGRFYAKLA